MNKLEKIVIIGGCGGIGTNLATHFLKKGFKTTSFDNLSSRFSKTNILKHKNYSFIEGDIKRKSDLRFNGDFVIHLASSDNYRDNISGDLNLIEYCKEKNIPLIFVSSNRIYSNLVNKIPFTEFTSRYVIGEKTGQYTKKGKPITKSKVYNEGIDETFPIDGLDNYFKTLYGASRYTGDMFTQEFSQLGLKATILRTSFVYGKYQYTDWLSYFMIARLTGRDIEIQGSGKEVTDALYVDDFSELMELIVTKFDNFEGKVFNIGGGHNPSFTVSKLEALNLIDILDQRAGFDNKPSKVKFTKGDEFQHRIYLSDIRKVSKYWKPKTTVFSGFEKKYNWIYENIDFIKEAL